MSYQPYRKILVSLAQDSIRHGLRCNHPLYVETEQFPDQLVEHRASFVTLQKNGQLRGCIGTLEAHRPLVKDIAHNGWSAAFRDPRFKPVDGDELDQLEIFISILSKPEPVEFESEQDLLEQIRPGEDGLILEAAGRRGTFLPSVWESLTEKRDFLTNLKMKAGLPSHYWSDEIKVMRYTTEYIK